jgi:cellulose synthase/poly-beta-1,6-N-acetylglucosamine synthase-like glycosyltransferase
VTESIEKSVIPPVKNETDLKNTIAATDKKTDKQNTSETAVTNNSADTYNNKETAQEEFDAVYASNNESKNRKLRGFFRKATRVFEKRTNISATDDNEERVMIGALAVKLK